MDRKEELEHRIEMTRILMVPHGGSRNDTLCTVEIKKCIHCREFMKTKKGFCFCACPSQIRNNNVL